MRALRMTLLSVFPVSARSRRHGPLFVRNYLKLLVLLRKGIIARTEICIAVDERPRALRLSLHRVTRAEANPPSLPLLLCLSCAQRYLRQGNDNNDERVCTVGANARGGPRARLRRSSASRRSGRFGCDSAPPSSREHHTHTHTLTHTHTRPRTQTNHKTQQRGQLRTRV